MRLLGISRMSSAPLACPSLSYAASLLAVIRMSGRIRAPAAALMSGVASKPPMAGMWMSITTTSTRPSRVSATASAPEAASTTSKFRRSSPLMRVRLTGSSSTRTAARRWGGGLGSGTVSQDTVSLDREERLEVCDLEDAPNCRLAIQHAYVLGACLFAQHQQHSQRRAVQNLGDRQVDHVFADPAGRGAGVPEPGMAVEVEATLHVNRDRRAGQRGANVASCLGLRPEIHQNNSTTPGLMSSWWTGSEADRPSPADGCRTSRTPGEKTSKARCSDGGGLPAATAPTRSARFTMLPMRWRIMSSNCRAVTAAEADAAIRWPTALAVETLSAAVARNASRLGNIASTRNLPV